MHLLTGLTQSDRQQATFTENKTGPGIFARCYEAKKKTWTSTLKSSSPGLQTANFQSVQVPRNMQTMVQRQECPTTPGDQGGLHGRRESRVNLQFPT